VTQRGDRTKAGLVRATIELVAELGYPQVSTRAIAARAGVSEATIYRHFPDKRALFTAALLEGHQPITEWMSDLPARAGTATVTANLSACLVQLCGLRDAVLPLERAMLDAPDLAGDRPPGSSGMTVESLGGPPHQLQQYLAAEQRLGRVRQGVDTTEVAVVLLATLFGLAAGPPLPGRTLDATVEGAVRLVVEGIAPDAGTAAKRVAG
jgi:AcrR family transcriptional regulator